MTLLDTITVGSLSVNVLDVDPRTGGGQAATIGALALIYNEGSPVGQLYIKTGAGNTAWELVSTTTASGTIAAGLVRRLALYPADGNGIDDQVSLNGNLADVRIVAQATRSAAITYNIPNPGDAITSADFVLTEGAQTIAGNKTFSNNVIINGDLDVNGTVTTIDTTNLQISDKLITLNRGGTAASGGQSGVEIEENAVITAFIYQNSARTGWEFKSSTIASTAALLTSSLTANRTFTLPDVSTTLVGRTGTPTAGYAAYWNDVNQLASEQFLSVSRGGTGVGGTPTNGQLLIGNGTGYTLATLTQGANQGVTITNGSGSITLATVQDIRTSASPTFVGLTLSGLSTAGFVKNSAAGVLSTAATVSLTTEVAGILPIANGGTNSGTALNNNRIMISSSGSIVEHSALVAGAVYFGAATTGLPAQDSANLFFDDTNDRLGIRTNAPSDALHIAGTTRISGAGSTLRLLADSDYIVSQAAVATTNATVTSLATIATTTDSVMLIEARVSGWRTSGSGSAGDSATYIRTARIKNVAGTVTLANLQSDYTSEDVGAWNATITVSGTNVLVQVTGAASTNINWKATVIRTVVN